MIRKWGGNWSILRVYGWSNLLSSLGAKMSRWAPMNPLFLPESVHEYSIPVLEYYMGPCLLCGNLVKYKLIQQYAPLKISITILIQIKALKLGNGTGST